MYCDNFSISSFCALSYFISSSINFSISTINDTPQITFSDKKIKTSQNSFSSAPVFVTTTCKTDKYLIKSTTFSKDQTFTQTLKIDFGHSLTEVKIFTNSVGDQETKKVRFHLIQKFKQLMNMHFHIQPLKLSEFHHQSQ